MTLCTHSCILERDCATVSASLPRSFSRAALRLASRYCLEDVACVQPLVQPSVMRSKPDDGDSERYRLDPTRFPRRLDLELDPAVLRRMEALAERSGRSISEVAAELFGQVLGDSIPEA